MPAISKLTEAFGSQAREFVVVAGELSDWGWKVTEMVLPTGHAGAVNRATSGFCVFCTTGVDPITGVVTINVTVLVADSPEAKSLATTCTWYLPSIPVTAQANAWDFQTLPLSVPTLKFLMVAIVPPGGDTLNWKVSGPA